MRLTISLIGLLACGVVAGTAPKKLRDDNIVPGAYVVEFTGDEDHESFYGTLRDQGLELSHRMKLKHELFNGASFSIRNHENPDVG